MSKEIIRANQFRRLQKGWEEPEFQLNNEQVSELNDLYSAVEQYKVGKLVTGKVVRADEDGVLVDIGYKSQGLIPNYEFSKFELKKLSPGSDIEVIVEELEAIDGSLKLSYENAKATRAWEEITKFYEEGKPVEGMVTHKVKGGLSVDVGVPAFLPGSQIDVQRITNFDQFLGQSITAHIIKINKKRGNIIISRRKYMQEQRAEDRKKILDTLSESEVIQGVVKNITNYGAFVDIGGVDGLLHITDMTWGRIGHPSELIKIGDTISVKVLSFDKDNEKISLGMKQLTDNPWEALNSDIKVGSIIKGKISSITDYGLFVEVAKGVEGLVHISEISWTERINDLNKLYKVGQEIEAVATALDKENRRMSLSIKQLSKNPWEQITEQFKIGQNVKGKISNVTDFGLFVELTPGIDGLVHVSDISWTEHIEHPNDMFKKGDQVDAVVLGIDEQSKRISLGIKQLSQDPWETIENEYPVNSIVDGEVSKITNFGAFIKLPTGIEGLIHKSQFGDKKVEDVLQIGQKTQFRVLRASKDDHKLALSMNLDEDAPVIREERAPRERQHRAQNQYRDTKPLKDRPKSAFQVELEKVAARHSADDNDQGE